MESTRHDDRDEREDPVLTTQEGATKDLVKDVNYVHQETRPLSDVPNEPTSKV